MRQLFQNLIANSVKFVRPGVTPIIRISGRPLPSERAAEIVIRDNGVGFDEKYSESIFKPFHRLQSGVEGVGLGLSVCQKIVIEHEGTIIVHSRPGEGTSFIITLSSADPPAK